MNATAKRRALAAATESDPRWAAVLARDARADGRFYYSVQSTGVYCRPSCAARQARPENVCFHASCADAERAGFRPCRRCKPDQPSLAQQHAQKVTVACRLIDDADTLPDLATLAAAVGLSRYHFHRLFKQHTGLTPKAYAAARRAERVRNGLKQHDTVTAAIFDAGFNANSRFYAQADAVLGMTPGDYRAGGARTVIRFAVGQCTLGAILVAQSERGVCAISLGDDAEALLHELQDRFPRAELIGGDAAFEQLVATVVGFVEAPALGLDLPLDVRGTAFQQRVWQALREIPPGETASYRDIARRIGAPQAVRAVAGACAANVLAVAIPCHRVVRTDGSLSGYRWGVARKQALLAREAKP
ncbi:bifunctional DNA-binding transcriptional regulator/O6-methylguanine-DNA methyltransferase Ada [Vogesella indigofera]|uniref:bifunctional DNA-binding transcriptional regulator/O6-methylguanine-DNA methyltransferase Ada n=1 Tax=Vogesella indigofera TaxID=45465 RepID=UPI00234F7405|nr:bifunctional DNA-binding transcriptional regulator/O6-methylguanine-DNA methyltransferase Ada [Vogesella indigofera]MDC7701817.1 bifunctional DNA-binding transcriptional regulator/O6-methylguanine-DNA methyltransferase Ada [Vogesella indigofera]